METRILPPAQETPEKPKLELKERVGIVEAILFVTGDAVEKSEIRRALDISDAELEETLDALESGYDFDCSRPAIGCRVPTVAGSSRPG